MDALLAEAVAAFPPPPRMTAIVIDAGGHPEEVVDVIRERGARVRAADPRAATWRVRVVTLTADGDALAAVEAAIAEQGLAEYWRGMRIDPDEAAATWATDGALVQLLIDDALTPAWWALVEPGGAEYTRTATGAALRWKERRLAVAEPSLPDLDVEIAVPRWRERTSGNVAGVGYSPAARTLEVRFKGGGVYRYGNVDPDEAAPLLTARPEPSLLHGESPGHYLSRTFVKRPDAHPYVRLDLPQLALDRQPVAPTDEAESEEPF